IAGYIYSTPAVSRGRVYVGNYAGELHAFNAGNAATVWTSRPGGAISGSPVVIGKVVYVSSLRKGRTWGYAVNGGRAVWEHPEGRYVPGIATRDALYLSMGSYLSR